MAPVAPAAGPQLPGWRPPPTGNPPTGSRPAPAGAPRLRWIAVRPGAPRPRPHSSGPLSPTPRYPGNPGWTLGDPALPGAPPLPDAEPAAGPSEGFVRATLLATAMVFAVAAAIHALRYLLLVINRSTLLPALIANGALWLGVIASAAALIAVLFCAMVLIQWLVARRAAVFAHLRRDDTRSRRALWLGCLIPVVNLLWAPVFLIETARVEGLSQRLRKPIRIWWALWVASTVVAIFATATSFTTQPQGIADNTATTTLAYLLGLLTVLALLHVYDGFVGKPVDRPAHRWVVVGSKALAAAGPAVEEAPSGPDDAEEPQAPDTVVLAGAAGRDPAE